MPQASRHGDFRILYRRCSSCMQQMMSFASGPSCKIRTCTSARRVRTLEIPMLSTVRSSRVTHLSLRPVPNYVSRPRMHQNIKEQLHDLKDDKVEDVRILVVWRLGGTGKSQLVQNYIREHRQDYTAVFWIEPGSNESIERTISRSTDSSTVTKWI